LAQQEVDGGVGSAGGGPTASNLGQRTSGACRDTAASGGDSRGSGSIPLARRWRKAWRTCGARRRGTGRRGTARLGGGHGGELGLGFQKRGERRRRRERNGTRAPGGRRRASYSWRRRWRSSRRGRQHRAVAALTPSCLLVWRRTMTGWRWVGPCWVAPAEEGREEELGCRRKQGRVPFFVKTFF
jgi:hypothetical protein